MGKIKELAKKTKKTFVEEGAKSLLIKTKGYITYHLHGKEKNQKQYKDILFINGCELPHPQRYRVDHQIEQLESYGITCDKVFYADLTLEMLKCYRGFVFYRCPVLPVIEEFTKKAKENNKVCFYDIDDLVFDTEYTNQIKYLDEMTKAERDLYDDGVNRMGKTLKLCEYGITTTSRLQKEMKKQLKDVFINRNVASESMVKYSDDAIKLKRDSNKVVIGYFSGSITHNDDFKLIMPVLVDLLKKYDNLYLQIVGLLDLPEEMESVREKVLTAKFTNWTELPKLIHSVDINIAPLEDTIFNEAKSENKWMEAALVKVPTAASDVGAFKEVIENGRTGFLCKNGKEWKKTLTELVENEELRNQVGQKAYDKVRKDYITTYSGKGLADFISSKLNKNIFFVLPSVNISGGTMVAMKHAAILKKNGYDVTLINAEEGENNIASDGMEVNVVSAMGREFRCRSYAMVATMWNTLEYIKRNGNCAHIKYLVQNYETNFYKYNRKEKELANATYNQVVNVEYLTISKWCEQWLKDDFNDKVKFAPNGINLDNFPYKERKFKGKIKILIEGDSKSFYKNTDESFKIVELLDKDKYEIHYLSYEGEPKKSYYFDEFHHRVPHSEVGKIYQECDILLKSSILESFSYPPLEMMATGGLCVVRPNDGNAEYLENEKNCLLYKPGDYEDAARQINRLADDGSLRKKLVQNGRKTAESRSWQKIENEIIKLYED